jgi:chromosome segregation ATPase
VAKNSAQLQQQREELQQSLEYMNQEHHELQLKIDHLKTEYDHVHDLNSHRQGLRNLMSLFQEINQQQSLLLNPPADMMEEYKLLIKQFRLWADVMEDVISEEKNQPIIEVSTKVKS